MNPRYERNVPALTEAECEALGQKRVLIVGCGGIGGYLIDMLARVGIGGLKVVDGDVFEPSNFNRQLLSDASVLGASKAKAAAAWVSRVNPEVDVEAVAEDMTQDNVRRLLERCDAVLDGLDNMESRRVLANACAEAGIPCIYGAVDGWVAQAGISMPGDHLIDILCPEGAAVKSGGVLSFTPALCASIQVSLCVKWLAGRAVETGTVYYFDLLHQEFETISMAW